jgi:fatty-acyl-CoA synthase
VRALVGLRRFGPTLAAGVVGGAARFPAAPAVIDDDGTITFADLERRSNALARGLAGHGLTEGRSIAVMCRNHRGFVELCAACSKLGVHVVLLNTGFAGPQVA